MLTPPTSQSFTPPLSFTLQCYEGACPLGQDYTGAGCNQTQESALATRLSSWRRRHCKASQLFAVLSDVLMAAADGMYYGESAASFDGSSFAARAETHLMRLEQDENETVTVQGKLRADAEASSVWSLNAHLYPVVPRPEVRLADYSIETIIVDWHHNLLEYNDQLVSTVEALGQPGRDVENMASHGRHTLSVGVVGVVGSADVSFPNNTLAACYYSQNCTNFEGLPLQMSAKCLVWSFELERWTDHQCTLRPAALVHNELVCRCALDPTARINSLRLIATARAQPREHTPTAINFNHTFSQSLVDATSWIPTGTVVGVWLLFCAALIAAASNDRRSVPARANPPSNPVSVQSILADSW